MIKKVTMIIAFVLISTSIIAQEDTAFRKDTEKLVSIVSESTFGSVINQFNVMIPEDKKEAFSKEVKATLPNLYSSIASIYMEEFTHSEIKELLKFYETPLGKKMAGKTMILAQKGMMAGQQWGVEIQNIMKKYQ